MGEKVEIISGSWNRVKNWVNKRIRLQDGNIFVGEDAGKVTTGLNNSFVGSKVGYSNVGGAANTFVGFNTGYTHVNGNNGCYIGYKAGYYETIGNKLFIDTIERADEADGRIKALIYGIFAAATADQILRINGILELTEISDYANNAAAITAGLTIGQVYRNGDGLSIVH